MLCRSMITVSIDSLKQGPKGEFVADRSSKASLNLSKHYIFGYYASKSPLISNFAKVFSSISLNENSYNLLCVASRRSVS